MSQRTPTKQPRKAAPATPVTPAPNAARAALPAMLDLLADLHLQQGFPAAAEHLARQAADLREGAQ